MLKRGHKDIYHRMSPTHRDRYLQEFAGRRNIRHAGTLRQMSVMVQVFEGRHIAYANLAKPNGLSSGSRS